MASNQLEPRTEAPHSIFPAAEPASFCSRPTPVVPANPALCASEENASEHASVRPAARPSTPSGSISDRPTFVPDDYIEPRRESPPSVTIEEETAGDPSQMASPDETPSLASRRLPPPLPVAPAVAAARAPTVPPRARGRRVHFARALFVVLFGAVGSLLGYAFRAELAHALGGLHGAAHPSASVK